MEELLVHSDLGASSTERWFNCPGSINLCKDIPEPPSESYADEGSCAHEVVAQALKDGNQAWFYAGEYYHNHEVTEEMAQHCQKYLDYIELQIKERGIQPSGVLVERKFTISDSNNELWGTSDCTLLEFLGLLEVIDYKHGRGVVVEVVNNSQAMYYALGALEEFKDYEIQKVKLTIVQPRAYHKDGPIRSWEISVDELKEFKKTLMANVARTKEPKAKLKEGDWCKWCRGASVCPELKGRVTKAVQVDFEDHSKTLVVPPTPFNPIDVSRSLQAIPRLKDWIKAVEIAALALAGSKIEIPCYKVVRSKKNRAFKDKDMVEKYLIQAKISPKVIYKQSLRTPKQILDAIPKKHNAAVELMVHVPEGILQVVPDFDIREPERIQEPEIDFPAITGESLVDDETSTDESFGQPHKGHFDEQEFEKEFGTDEPPKTSLVVGRSKGTGTRETNEGSLGKDPQAKKKPKAKTPTTKKGKPKTKIPKPNKKVAPKKKATPLSKIKSAKTKSKVRPSGKKKKLTKFLRRK